jgi:two-component system sensor histidine kinase DesK
MGVAAQLCLTNSSVGRSIPDMEIAVDKVCGPLTWKIRLLAIADSPLVWLFYLPLYVVPWFWVPPGQQALVGSLLGLCVFLSLYAWGLKGGASDTRIIVAAAAILFLSFVLAPAGGTWAVISIYAAAMTGMVRRPRTAVVALTAYALIMSVFGIWVGAAWFNWGFGLLLGVLAGIANMSRMALEGKNAALVAAQGEVRALAEVAERERIARDLHDLLGRSLTLVALKADLAVKLSSRDPIAAGNEMREVATVARNALAEVRAAVAGMQGAGLANEIQASVAALAAAGVTAEVEGSPEEIAPPASAVLAMALREAVTNVIRHAGAANCRIVVGGLGQAQLTVIDDGRGGVAMEGSGLRGMRARIAAAGGRMEVEHQPSGTSLFATVPMDAP